MIRAYVGVGANLGDPLAQLRFAREALATSPHIRLINLSAIYRTAPIGPGRQDDYLNGVVALDTEYDAPQLLARLHTIEGQAGRIRRERWGPRTLDLDLLWMAGARYTEPDLTVPHPRLEERNFVLLPLADIVGLDWTLPSGRCIEEAIASTSLNPITRTALSWAADAPAAAGASA